MQLLVQSAAAYLAATIVAAPASPKPPAAPPVASAATVLSPAKGFALTGRLSPERPTVFLFYRPDSGMEKALADRLDREVGPVAGLRWVPLKTGDEPLAKQCEIKQTPTAIIYDRRGRLVLRTSDPESVGSAVRKALGVMRIDWAADDDPRMDQIEDLIGRRARPGIMRTMSLKPEWLAAISDLAQTAHKQPGYLDVRTKEMIATHVSALNKCKF